MKKGNRIIRKALKVIGIILLSVVCLLLILIGLIRIPAVQQEIVSRAESYLQEEIGTEVSIGHLYLAFPKSLDAEDVYLEDQQGDTLLYFSELSVDTDLWALLDNTIELNSIYLEGLVNNVRRNSDSTFNFTYIIEAFDTGTEPQPEPTSEPWEFSIEDIELEKINVDYRDELANSSLSVNLGNLEVEFEEVNPTKSIFHIASVTLQKTDFQYVVHEIPTSSPQNGTPGGTPSGTPDKANAIEQDTAATPLNIQVENVEIVNSDFLYKTPQQHFDLNIGAFEVATNNINLEENKYDVESILLEGSTVTIAMAETSTADTTTSDTTSSEPVPLDIQLGELSLAGNVVNYSMGEIDSTTQGFNPNHITIEALDAELKDMRYTADLAEGTINNLSFKDPDGLSLQELQADFNMEKNSITVPNFHLATKNSEINLRAQSEFASLEEFMQPQTTIELAIDDSKVGTKDLLYFNPELNKNTPLDLASLEPIEISTTARGTLQQLNIEEFRVALSRTFLNLNGSVGNLTNPESLSFDITQSLTSSRQDLKRLLPDSLYPTGINLPEKFELKSSIAGTANDLGGTADLTSSLGDFHIHGNYSMGRDSIPQYDVALSTKGFDVGTLTGQPQQFGQLIFELTADGRGATLETINAELKGTINRFDFQQYTYNDLSIDGRLNKGLFAGSLEMDDKNLKFTFDGSVDQMAEEKLYQATLDIEKVDLQALNFSQTPLTLAAEIETDLKTEDFKRFNGDLSIRNFSANNGIDTYRVDSLLYSSIDQDGKTEISIDSDLMEGRFQGNVDLFSLPEALTNHFNYYYTLQDTVIRDTLNNQQFELSLDLKKTDLITEIIVPELERFKPGRLEASFNSADRELNFDLNIKELKYGDVLVDSILLFANSNEQNLIAGLQVNGVNSQDFSVPQLKFTADVEEDFFDTRLAIRDSADEKQYLIKAQFQSAEDEYRFELDSDSLMLAYEMWNVNSDNHILFDPSGFNAHSFVLSKGQQQVSLETLEDSTHKVSFDQFKLITISDAIGKKDSLLTGTLDGFVKIAPIDTTFGFSADLSIADIAYLQEQLGTLKLEARKGANEQYTVLLTATGANRMELSGEYFPTQTEQTQFDLKLQKIDLSSFSTLASGTLNELYGTLTGNISIDGDLTDPDMNGRLNFSETGINPAAIGTILKIDDETIRINNSTFKFNNFQLKDKNNKTATLNGELTLEDATFYRFDLNLRARDFQVLNTDSDDSDLYYGKLRIDADADVTGTSAEPNVDLTIEVREESNVSYVIPESEYTALDQSNVVVFKGPPGSDTLKTKTKAMDSVANEFQGVELNANIEINNKATFNIIIDPLTNDQLTVHGNANLTVDMNRQGDLQLAGRYELTSGTYNFSFYKLVQREFSIVEGSSITWTGDPMEANLDITASYRVETSPIDLMGNQISNTSSSEYNQYRQQFPFLVYLNIDGELTQPEISFQLDMPREDRNALGGSVYGKIQDINSRESELNKQVFALLILQRFISDDPFSSEGGASLADNTRRSVSRIMSEQLNRLAENIEGVDVTFDLQSYEDYSAEGAQGRTDLEVGLSRNLFNERVVVKVSGNVNLEGGERQKTAADYIGDLVIEYKITEDGRLRASGFRRTEFDVINGEIIETGTGLIYMREYDAFKELFNFDEEE